jgi:peptide/nickel transport system substrate-binding protein
MTLVISNPGTATRRALLKTIAAASLSGAIPAFATTRNAVRAEGSELVVGWEGISYKTEPGRATIGMTPLNTNIFESLVRLGPDYSVEPMLAESWELIEPNTFRFTLRQGVVFHDGTPFTSEAVKWSMDRLSVNPAVGLSTDSTVILDDYTVEITPTSENRRFVEQLVHPSRGSIVAPGSEPADTRIGTGPFREVEYVVDDRYVVEAFPDYWGDAPAVSRITFRFYPDATTRVMALQAGEVDMIGAVPRESVGELTDAGFTILTSPVGAYSAFYVNIHGNAPYDLGQDPVIREALTLAIDKPAIIEGIWQGNAEPGVSIVPPTILGGRANLVQGPAYDPDAARALLEEAGWKVGTDGVREKDGRRLAMEMIVGYPNAATHGQMPELLQAQLREIGLEVILVQTPDTGAYEVLLQDGTGDLWVETGNQNDANPCFLPDLLFASPDPDGDAASNAYANAFAPGAAFDEFIAACRTAPSTGDVQEAAARAMRLLVDELFVVAPIAGVYRIYAAQAGVTGFEPHPSGVNQRWTTVSLAG